jgi:hypothetical protein
MRPLPRFRSCSIDITACRLAGTGQLDALTAANRKGTFWKQKSPISLYQLALARLKFVPFLSFMSDLNGRNAAIPSPQFSSVGPTPSRSAKLTWTGLSQNRIYEFTAWISPTFVNPDAQLRIAGAPRSNR